MENIQVILRIRPPNPNEVETNDQEVWQVFSNTVSVTQSLQEDLFKTRKIGSGSRTEFTYNHCFDKNKTNVYIYESVVKRIAFSSLNGINGTVFMYGQTGSGKTFTMMGPHGHADCHSHTDLARESSGMKTSLNLGDRSGKSSVTFDGKKSIDSFKMFDTKNMFNRPKNPSVTRTPIRSLNPGSMSVSKERVSMEMEKNFGSRKASPSAESLNGDLKSSFPIEKSPRIRNVLTTSLSFAEPQKNYEINRLKNHPENMEGILSLAMKDLFKEIDSQTEKKFFLRVSYLEIYNDMVYDLLKQADKLNEPLTINQDANKGFFIKGAIEEIVSSIEEVLQKIQKGEANRHYASTNMNHSSSRSHAIFRLYVQSMPAKLNETQNNYITESVLNFVDLAGSERVDVHDKSKAKGRQLSLDNLTPLNLGFNIQKERIKESQRINKSLFFLTQVISLKSQGKPDAVIPYRNSPLTKILRSSLGGNSRTAVILCINPCISQLEQTMSTLRFGLNAKKIENKVQANIISNASDETVKNLLREYEKKIMDMEKEKNMDKNASQNLLKIIQNLQDQKNLLAERLVLLKKYENYPSGVVDLTKTTKEKLKREHLHYGNVGILHVLTTENEKDTKLTYDFEGKYALDSLKEAKKENYLLEEKIKDMENSYQILMKEKEELVQETENNKKLIKRKKSNILQIKRALSKYSNENHQYKNILGIFLNKNTQGLKKLPLEVLNKVEKKLLAVFDNIKLHRVLKTINNSVPKEIDGNSQFNLYDDNILDSLSNAGKNLKTSHLELSESDLDYDDFQALAANSNGYKKVKTEKIESFVKKGNDQEKNETEDKKETILELKDNENLLLPFGSNLQGSSLMETENNKDDNEADNKDKEEKGEEENLDARLEKLRGNYSKIMGLFKIDAFASIKKEEPKMDLEETPIVKDSIDKIEPSNSYLPDKTNSLNENLVDGFAKPQENQNPTLKAIIGDGKENTKADLLSILNSQREKIEKMSANKFSHLLIQK